MRKLLKIPPGPEQQTRIDDLRSIAAHHWPDVEIKHRTFSNGVFHAVLDIPVPPYVLSDILAVFYLSEPE